MSFGLFTLTGSASILGGAPAEGYVIVAGIPQTIIDQAGDEIWVGPKRQLLDRNGEFNIALPSDSLSGPSSTFGFRITFDLNDEENPDSTEFYAPQIGATVDLSTLATQVVEPVGDTTANRIAAEDAAERAEAAAATASGVGATSDSAMAFVANNAASAFRAALTGLYLPQGISGILLNVANFSSPQAACDAADAAGGRIVYAGPGAYSLGSTTLSVPRNSIFTGAGRGTTVLNYTGTGTAIQMYNPGTAEQKKNVRLVDFTLNAPNAAMAVNAKGMSKGQIERVEMFGQMSPALPTAGSIGVLWDGSYGGSIGCWWNTIRDSWIYGFDTCVKSTGVVNAGQANENKVVNTRLERYSGKGYWVNVGDHNTAEHCDFTSTLDGCVGAYIEDSQFRMIDCRFEQTDICVRVASGSAMAPEFISNTISSSCLVGYQYDSGTTNTRGRIRGGFNNATTPVLDNSSNRTDGTSLHYRGVGNVTQISFYKSAVTASLSNSALDVAGAAGITSFSVGRSYQIRGVSARLSTAVTAGSITIAPSLGGTASTSLTASMATGVSQVNNWQGMGKNVNAEGSANSVGVRVTTTSDFAPTTAVLLVTVWIEFL